MSKLLDETGLATLWSIIKARDVTTQAMLTEQGESLEVLTNKGIVSYKGTWVSGTYSYLDAVTMDGSLYTCVNSEGTRATPGDSDDWEQTVAAGTDGDDKGITVCLSQTHFPLTVDSSGAVEQTLDTAGDVVCAVTAWRGSEQLKVSGISFTENDENYPFVADQSDDYTQSIYLQTIVSTTRTVANFSVSIAPESGYCVFTVIVEDGDNTYTYGDYKITISVDYSKLYNALLATTLKNLGNTLTAVSTLASAVSTVTTQLQTVAEAVQTIGTAVSIEEYTEGTDAITTTVDEALETVTSTVTTLTSEVTQLSSDALSLVEGDVTAVSS